MEKIVYQTSQGVLEMQGTLLESKETYEGKEERRTHVDNGVYSTITLDVTSFQEKWQILKTDKSKENISIKRRVYENEDTGKKAGETVFWNDFDNKVVHQGYDEEKLAKEYGKFIEKQQ